MARDYNTLIADVGNWLARDDLAAVIPTFIDLAEDRLADELRIRAMTKRSRAVGNGTRFIELPTDYLDMRRLWLVSATPYTLNQVAPESLQPWNASSPDRPDEYVIHEELEFDNTLSRDQTVEMLYWARFPALTPSNLSNWLVVNNYGSYLFGSLVEAAPYLVADERIPMWESRYQAHTAALLESDKRSRIGGKPSVKIMGSTP